MYYYEIGNIVKQRRKQLKLSQSSLAEGIITTVNLSKLESGLQIPRKEKLGMILGRLGLSDRILFNYCLNERESDIQRMRKDIMWLNYERKYEEASQLIKKLEFLPEYSEGVNRQFILYVKIPAMGDSTHQRFEIIDALKITISTFSENYIKDFLFTSQEAQLVNMLAITYADEGNTDKAIEILKNLKTSLERSRIEEVEKTELFPLVLYNLTKYLGLSEKYNEAIELCDYAIKLCVKYNTIRMLPEILYNKAFDLYYSGDTPQCKRILTQAYFVCDAVGRFERRDEIKNYAKEKLDIVLDV